MSTRTTCIIGAAILVVLVAPGATQAASKTVSMGVPASALKEGVSYFGMLPQNLAVAVGTTVTFASAKGATEEHAASFGPGDPNDTASYMGALVASFAGAVPDQRAMYPSEPPGPAALTPDLHGNGFWNSGVLDSLPTTRLPASSTVTFASPGIYEYLCFIHPAMTGTVTVK